MPDALIYIAFLLIVAASVYGTKFLFDKLEDFWKRKQASLRADKEDHDRSL